MRCVWSLVLVCAGVAWGQEAELHVVSLESVTDGAEVVVGAGAPVELVLAGVRVGGWEVTLEEGAEVERVWVLCEAWGREWGVVGGLPEGVPVVQLEEVVWGVERLGAGEEERAFCEERVREIKRELLHASEDELEYLVEELKETEEYLRDSEGLEDLAFDSGGFAEALRGVVARVCGREIVGFHSASGGERPRLCVRPGRVEAPEGTQAALVYLEDWDGERGEEVRVRVEGGAWVLVLSSEFRRRWVLELAPGAEVVGVVLAGWGVSEVEGVPEDAWLRTVGYWAVAPEGVRYEGLTGWLEGVVGVEVGCVSEVGQRASVR